MNKIVYFFILLAVINSAYAAECNENLNKNTVLDSDLDCNEDGLIIGTDGINLDCNNHKINGNIGIKVNADNIRIQNCIIDGLATHFLLKIHLLP